MTGRGGPPLAVGDRVMVRRCRTMTLADDSLHDAVVSVLRVDDQNCGCWRITVERPPGRDPNPEASSTMQVYGADCTWPHLDRIDYAAARADATAPFAA